MPSSRCQPRSGCTPHGQTAPKYLSVHESQRASARVLQRCFRANRGLFPVNTDQSELMSAAESVCSPGTRSGTRTSCGRVRWYQGEPRRLFRRIGSSCTDHLSVDCCTHGPRASTDHDGTLVPVGHAGTHVPDVRCTSWMRRHRSCAGVRYIILLSHQTEVHPAPRQVFSSVPVLSGEPSYHHADRRVVLQGAIRSRWVSQGKKLPDTWRLRSA